MKKLVLLLSVTSAAVHASIDTELTKAVQKTHLTKVQELLPYAQLTHEEKDALLGLALHRINDLKQSYDALTHPEVGYVGLGGAMNSNGLVAGAGSYNAPVKSYDYRTDIGFEPHYTYRHFFGDIAGGAIIGCLLSLILQDKERAIAAFGGAVVGTGIGFVTSMVMYYLNEKNYPILLRYMYDNAVAIEFEIRQKKVTA